MILPRKALVFFILVLSLPQPITAREKEPLPSHWTAQKAVLFVLQHNPDAQVALQRINAADADIKSAKAAFYPQLGISTEYSRTNNPMYSFGNILNQGMFSNTIDFNNPGITDTLQGKATLQYRFYNGGHDLAALDAAGQYSQATRQQQAAIRSQLGFETIRAFYTIIQAKDTLQAKKSAVEAITASLSVAHARYQEGSLLQEDLLNLQVQQAAAQEQLIQAQHGFHLAQRGFLQLLGLNGGEVRLDPIASQVPEIPVERDIHNRPELAAMALAVKAQEAMVRQARSGRYPSVDAFGSYQVDKGIELEDGSGNSWAAGVRVNYALFDGQQTTAAIDQANARLMESREQLRKMELALNFELERATLALHQEEERLKVTGTMVASAMESARLSRLRFKEGVLLSSDLIDTENRLTAARISHALATTSRIIAIADLRRAVGLAQFNQGKQP
jgi:outer membrane protein TolC